MPSNQDAMTGGESKPRRERGPRKEKDHYNKNSGAEESKEGGEKRPYRRNNRGRGGKRFNEGGRPETGSEAGESRPQTAGGKSTMVYKKVKRNEGGEGYTMGGAGDKKTGGQGAQGTRPLTAADLKKQASVNSNNRFSAFE
jgi:hypothetical protein